MVVVGPGRPFIIEVPFQVCRMMRAMAYCFPCLTAHRSPDRFSSHLGVQFHLVSGNKWQCSYKKRGPMSQLEVKSACWDPPKSTASAPARGRAFGDQELNALGMRHINYNMQEELGVDPAGCVRQHGFYVQKWRRSLQLSPWKILQLMG
jgi:hypothetical protein